jgi:hypothetical protein
MKTFVSGDSLFSLSCSQLWQTLLPANTYFIKMAAEIVFTMVTSKRVQIRSQKELIL